MSSDWAIISDDTHALTHDLLMRIAKGADESERIRTLAVTIYGPQHDDTARTLHTAAELQPLKEKLRASIKRMRDELDNE